jgi:hypothetical protein
MSFIETETPAGSWKIPPQSPPWLKPFAKTTPSDQVLSSEKVNDAQAPTTAFSFTTNFEERRARARDINRPPSKIPLPKRRDISPARGLPPTKRRRSEDIRNQHSQANEARRVNLARAKARRIALQKNRMNRIMATRLPEVGPSTIQPKSTVNSDVGSSVVTTEAQEPPAATTQSVATVDEVSPPTDEEPKPTRQV